MSTVTLTKWGNSTGVRIPASVMKEAHLSLGEKLEIATNQKGDLILSSINDPQKGWLEAFNAVATAGEDELLLDLSNDFDEDEWRW